jgi:hypothetical protein
MQTPVACRGFTSTWAPCMTRRSTRVRTWQRPSPHIPRCTTQLPSSSRSCRRHHVPALKKTTLRCGRASDAEHGVCSWRSPVGGRGLSSGAASCGRTLLRSSPLQLPACWLSSACAHLAPRRRYSATRMASSTLQTSQRLRVREPPCACPCSSAPCSSTRAANQEAPMLQNSRTKATARSTNAARTATHSARHSSVRSPTHSARHSSVRSHTRTR